MKRDRGRLFWIPTAGCEEAPEVGEACCGSRPGSRAGVGSKVQGAGPDQEASCITMAVITASPALHLLPVCSRPPLQADEERPKGVCLALGSHHTSNPASSLVCAECRTHPNSTVEETGTQK